MSAALTINQITRTPLNNEVVIAQYAAGDNRTNWITNYGRAGHTSDTTITTTRSPAHTSVPLSDDIITAVKAIYEHPTATIDVAWIVVDAFYAELTRARIVRELDETKTSRSVLIAALAAMAPGIESISNNAGCMSFEACKELVRAVRAVSSVTTRHIDGDISDLETQLRATGC